MERILKVHPSDNIIVALQDFQAGNIVELADEKLTIAEDIPIKHKFAAIDFEDGDAIIMYGVKIGIATQPIRKGQRISVDNVRHFSEDYQITVNQSEWTGPDITAYNTQTFNGYYREDGKVGTRNYWIVFPLVFCENRNIRVIERTMLEQLGYGTEGRHAVDLAPLLAMYHAGAGAEEILKADITTQEPKQKKNQLFPNVDGIKFLLHDGGCGGIRQDAEALCRLLAGYITNSNVAGATILSLGCQNAQFSILEEALQEMSLGHQKPVYILEQQKSNSEKEFIAEAVKKTFVGLIHANQIERQPAPLSKLVLGLECGGSDGFSGITANPALGHTSDMLVQLGGTTILSEFPELNGVEQELIHRCMNVDLAKKFADIMDKYGQRAKDVGSGFDMNPSPGNIKDGLITDAMKSAGAAKKGGTSPVTDVLDYTEQANTPGLNLLCTPGNDVESTTGLAGSGANMIVFTTGLGTPTGNPIAPTIKFSSNTSLANKMKDIIDLDAGTIVSGTDTIESKGEELLELIIKVANGEKWTKAELLGQNDFIPWKRGISL